MEIHRVLRLPTEEEQLIKPLVPGDEYYVGTIGDDKWKHYKVDNSGVIRFVSGLTENEDIKLSGLKTQSEINTDIEVAKSQAVSEVFSEVYKKNESYAKTEVFSKTETNGLINNATVNASVGAVQITGNTLPALGNDNKRYIFTTGNEGRTLTYGSTNLVYSINKQCSAFWDGTAKIWTKEDETDLPIIPTSSQYGENENIAGSQKLITETKKSIGKSDFKIAGSTDAGKLVKINGVVDNTELPYSVVNFSVTANSKCKVHVELASGVSASQYAIISLWNDSTWIKDALISTTSLIYDCEITIPNGVNTVKALTSTANISKLVFVDNGNIMPYVAPDASIEEKQITEKATLSLSGNRVAKTNSAVATKKLINISGAIIDTTFSYDVVTYDVVEGERISIFDRIAAAVNNTYAIAVLYNDSTFSSVVIPAVTNGLIYKADLVVPKGVNKLHLCVTTGRLNTQHVIVTTQGVEQDKDYNQIKTNVDSNTANLSGFIKKGTNYIGLFNESKIGFYRSTGVFNDTTASYPNWKCELIAITPGKKYKWRVVSAIENSYLVVFDANMQVIDFTLVTTSSQFATEQSYTAQSNAYYFATPARNLNSSNNLVEFFNDEDIQTTSLPNRVKALESRSQAPKILPTITFPPIVYGTLFNANTINFYNRIYAEGVTASKVRDLSINGNPSAIVDSTNTSSGNVTLSFTVSAQNYADVARSLTYRRIAISNGQNKSIRGQQIGDSLTDGGYPAVMEFITKAWNQDLGNINYLPVGTRIDNLTIALAGYSFTNRACNEGRGGWAVSDYLRKICITRARNGTQTFQTIIGKPAWDSLGLGTMTRNGVKGRDYVAFVDNQENGDLMRLACHGWFDADPSVELWNWICVIKSMSGKSFTLDSTTYTFGTTYSTADDLAQVAFIKFCCRNNLNSTTGANFNPFYDYDTVQSTNGSYAFNYDSYLAKYKTVDINGNRLVIGSTAGSAITTSGQLTSWDLCDPTHITIVMNENDSNLVNNGTAPADDCIFMAERIRAYNSNIKISIGASRGYGAFAPERYQSIGFLNEIDVTARRLESNNRLMTAIPSYFTYLPTYFVQSVIGSYNGKAVDTLNQQVKIRYNGDALHTGEPLEYLDRAYLVLAWIWNTL